MDQPNQQPELDAIEALLTSRLYRFDCPTAMELGEYHLDLVDRSRRREIGQHLMLCPRCAAEYASLKAFMAQPDVEPAATARAPQSPNFVEKIKWLVADLIQPPSAGLLGGLAPAYRGGGAGGQLRNFRAGDYEINLEVQDDADQPGRKLVVGLLLGAELPYGVTAGLQIPGTAEPSAPVEVDELGNFILAGVAPGVYDLLISDYNHVLNIRIPGFDVRS